jgi:prepilin-type N-terminal cleavage/methylation domain-containing protein
MRVKSRHLPGRHSPRSDRAFTLVELLVSIAILALLVGILLPTIDRARLLARVSCAKAELAGIERALELYAEQYRALPPSRTYCSFGSPEKVEDWAELPVELVEAGLLPGGDADTDLSVGMADPFNPERTYKYLRPGVGYHNGMQTSTSLWVAENFPGGGETGREYFDPEDSPVRYAVWSVGTFGDVGYWRALELHHPLLRSAWYGVDGRREGLIVRAMRPGGQGVASP